MRTVLTLWRACISALVCLAVADPPCPSCKPVYAVWQACIDECDALCESYAEKYHACVADDWWCQWDRCWRGPAIRSETCDRLYDRNTGEYIEQACHAQTELSCWPYDKDNDADVDLRDLAAIQKEWQ